MNTRFKLGAVWRNIIGARSLVLACGVLILGERCGAYDFGNDGKPDVLWRNSATGDNRLWLMNGLNTDWRIASQELAETTWRLTRPSWNFNVPSYGEFSATVVESPPSITLRFNIPPNESYGVSIYRRLEGAASWGSPLVSGWTQNQYTDSAVQTGVRYEYRVLRDFQTFPFPLDTYLRRYELTAGIKAPAVETCGRIILLVDNTLASALAGSLDQLQQNLVGDGWVVVRHDVPRHDDGSWAANPAKIASIKSMVLSSYNAAPADTKGVFIVGHVAVPYSGILPTDFHDGAPGTGADHRGAWPADMYYGSLDGTWTGDSATQINTQLPENSNSPADGKWDANSPPAPLALFVGRIDFARMPQLGVNPPGAGPDPKEVQLLQAYLNKAHRHRQKIAPFPLVDRALAYGGWPLTVANDHLVNTALYSNAKEISSALFGWDAMATGKLAVGDPLFPRSRSSLWGFLCGRGGSYSVHGDGSAVFQHQTGDFSNAANAAPVGFLMLNGSYFSDWNMADSLLRAPLAMTDYGLAATFFQHTEPEWGRLRFGHMGQGETLGGALLRTLNHPFVPPQPLDRDRAYTILGDPTLTAHTTAPASSLNGSRSGNLVTLTWSASAEPVAGYYVYSAATSAGPFQRISGAVPVPSPFVYSTGASLTYMVRAVRLLTTGSGSYYTLSQGITKQVN